MNNYDYSYTPETEHSIVQADQSRELSPTHTNAAQHTSLPVLSSAMSKIQRNEAPGNAHVLAVRQLQRTHGNLYVQRLIARQGSGTPDVSPDVESDIHASRGQGQPLDLNVRRQMEPALNTDLSRVRVHTDERADTMSQSLNAKAFTTGSDVYFRQGAYNPGSSSGRELIAHELTHVVQQSGSTVQTKLTVNTPGDRYEQEADHTARAIIQQEHTATPVQRADNDKLQMMPDSIQRAEEDEKVQAKLDDAGIQRQPEEEEKKPS